MNINKLLPENSGAETSTELLLSLTVPGYFNSELTAAAPAPKLMRSSQLRIAVMNISHKLYLADTSLFIFQFREVKHT